MPVRERDVDPVVTVAGDLDVSPLTGDPISVRAADQLSPSAEVANAGCQFPPRQNRSTLPPSPGSSTGFG